MRLVGRISRSKFEGSCSRQALSGKWGLNTHSQLVYSQRKYFHNTISVLNDKKDSNGVPDEFYDEKVEKAAEFREMLSLYTKGLTVEDITVTKVPPKSSSVETSSHLEQIISGERQFPMAQLFAEHFEKEEGDLESEPPHDQNYINEKFNSMSDDDLLRAYVSSPNQLPTPMSPAHLRLLSLVQKELGINIDLRDPMDVKALDLIKRYRISKGREVTAQQREAYEKLKKEKQEQGEEVDESEEFVEVKRRDGSTRIFLVEKFSLENSTHRYSAENPHSLDDFDPAEDPLEDEFLNKRDKMDIKFPSYPYPHPMIEKYLSKKGLVEAASSALNSEEDTEEIRERAEKHQLWKSGKYDEIDDDEEDEDGELLEDEETLLPRHHANPLISEELESTPEDFLGEHADVLSLEGDQAPLHSFNDQGERSCPGKRQRSGKLGILRCHKIDLAALSHLDIITLHRYLSPGGEILSKVETGLCTKCQRTVSKTIKRARHFGLLPHIEDFRVIDMRPSHRSKAFHDPIKGKLQASKTLL